MNTPISSQVNGVMPARLCRAGFPAAHFLLLLVVATCMFFAGLGRLPLIEPDEGRNAEVAREMLKSGDWVTPHFDDFAYLDKPPVYFWLVATAFKLGGRSELTARLASALAALGTMLLAWFLARRMFGNTTGLYAGIVFAVSPLAVVFARQVIFDMTLTFFVTVAMVCFWLGEAASERRTLFDLLFFAALGLATLTKGPVGFLLPILSIIVFKVLRGKPWKNFHWGIGLLTFFAITLPWFIAVSIRHPDFPKYALWWESLARFTTGSSHRSGPVYYYALIYLAGFLPWSFFLLYAVYNKLKCWRDLRQDSLSPVLYLLSWVGVVFVFFTISRSKLPGYFLPAMVPLSILMACVWQSTKLKPEPRSPDWLTGGFATLIVLGIACVLIPRFWGSALLHGRLATKMPPYVLALIEPSLTYTGVILGALGIIGRDLCARAREKAPTVVMFALLVCTFPLMLLRWRHPLSLYVSADSSKQLAETILASAQKNLPICGYYYFRTSLPFYLERPVCLVTSDGDELTSNYIVSQFSKIRKGKLGEHSSGNPNAASHAPLLMTESEWLFERNSTPILVLVRNGEEGRLAAGGHDVSPLWSGWKYSVWEMLPNSDGQPASTQEK